MKLIKYLAAGGAAAVVDIGIFSGLINYTYLGWFFSGLISFFFATCLNYVLSSKFVFPGETRRTEKEKIALVFIVSGFGLTVNQLMLYLFIEIFSYNPFTSKILASSSVFFLNYLSRRFFIFV